MAFSLQWFIAIRPYLYHLTSLDNLPSIQVSRQLHSANELATDKERLMLARRRQRRVSLDGNGTTKYLQTQKPLHEGNIELQDGWSFQQLIDRLNSLVFFWPGNEDGPIAYGKRHLQANEWESDVVELRFPSSELVPLQASTYLLFCPYNSGSPRCSCGKKSPRGADTFRSASTFSRTAGKVVEVVFENRFPLPSSTQFRRVLTSSWLPLDSQSRVE